MISQHPSAVLVAITCSPRNRTVTTWPYCHHQFVRLEKLNKLAVHNLTFDYAMCRSQRSSALKRMTFEYDYLHSYHSYLSSTTTCTLITHQKRRQRLGHRLPIGQEEQGTEEAEGSADCLLCSQPMSTA